MNTTETDTLASRLKEIDTFSQVPEEQLRWLAERGEVRELEDGELLFRYGDSIDHMSIGLEGAIEFRSVKDGANRQLTVFGKNSISGVLPYSRLTSTVANGVAIGHTKVFLLHRDHFHDLIQQNFELAEALVHHMTDRVRNFTAYQQQNEKLKALGKLSAGLAHELNNPASAMVRSSDELMKRLSQTPEKFKAVMSLRLNEKEIDAVTHLLFNKIEGGINDSLSLMEKTEMEDELSGWMDEHGVEQSYELTETLVEYRFTAKDLEFICKHVSESSLAPVLRWLDDVLTTDKMVSEIKDAAGRISDLVSSVKTYSHMDQGHDKQPVAFKKLIKSTVSILGHKIRQKNIDITLDIPERLPRFDGNISELNQVWMNILDNAIDAVEQNGKIKVKIETDTRNLYITFTDNGSGIPEEIQSRIFDPFYTTKKTGKGTGLGLDIVQKIVRRHDGSVNLSSEPGHTEFEICFPLIDK